MRDGEPWFVAKDACDCLVITNVSKACQILDEDEKGITKVYTLGESQDMMLIPRCYGIKKKPVDSTSTGFFSTNF